LVFMEGHTEEDKKKHDERSEEILEKQRRERDGCQAMAEDSYGDVWSAADRSSASEHTDSSERVI